MKPRQALSSGDEFQFADAGRGLQDEITEGAQGCFLPQHPALRTSPTWLFPGSILLSSLSTLNTEGGGGGGVKFINGWKERAEASLVLGVKGPVL